MRTALTLLALCALLGAVHGHAYFKCPKPRSSSNSDLKDYPCGRGAANNDFAGPYTPVSPGPLTVVVKETVNHNGAPMRFALSMGNDNGFENTILLDHLPHWDNSPYGTPRYYYVTIEIPDVNCTDVTCVLQNVQIMTDKISSNPGYCTEIDGSNPSCFSVYHSCTNIRINGSIPIDEYTHNYTAPAGFLDPHPNRWYKGESGSYTTDGPDGGYSDLQTYGQIAQPGVCEPCVGGNSAACDDHVDSLQLPGGDPPIVTTVDDITYYSEGTEPSTIGGFSSSLDPVLDTSAASSIIPAAVAVLAAVMSYFFL